jgi:hypothetical protein
MSGDKKMFDLFTDTETTPSMNKNARIESRVDRTGKVRTETVRREPGTVRMAASTDVNTNSTNVYIDSPTDRVSLDGRTARTLYALLQKHYSNLGKTA